MKSKIRKLPKGRRDYLLKRIYGLLRSDDISVVIIQLDGYQGETDFETIWLDPRKKFLSTFLHECIHVFYPALAESKVLALEYRLRESLTNRQWLNLTRRLLEVIQ